MKIVVSGAIIRDGQIYLTKRKPNQTFQGTWESPGGKVNEGESRFNAVVRETKEEINVDIISAYLAAHVELPSILQPESIDFWLFVVMKFRGEPTPQEGQEGGWFNLHQFQKLDLAPGNRAVVRELLRSIGDACRCPARCAMNALEFQCNLYAHTEEMDHQSFGTPDDRKAFVTWNHTKAPTIKRFGEKT